MQIKNKHAEVTIGDIKAYREDDGSLVTKFLEDFERRPGLVFGHYLRSLDDGATWEVIRNSEFFFGVGVNG